MTFLILGILLWAMTHFIPVFAREFRASIIARLKPRPYRALFALVILFSVGLMIYGWRSVEPTYLYDLPFFVRHIMMLLVLIAVILFGAAKSHSRIRRFIRNPMLSGVAVWAIAHLLVNGDTRSVVLFGGMLVWAMVSILGCNRRDGSYVAPVSWSWWREGRMLAVSGLVYLGLVFLHPYLSGIPLF